MQAEITCARVNASTPPSSVSTHSSESEMMPLCDGEALLARLCPPFFWLAPKEGMNHSADTVCL